MYNNFVNPYYPQSLVDIGQVSSDQEAVNAYVAAGRSKIMFTPDDRTVYVKCVSMNGQTSMDIFDRRPEAVLPAPDYVTRERIQPSNGSAETGQKVR